MTEILPPTRKQLSEFIGNHETLRRFEILFRMVGEDLPDAIANNSEAALSVANSALALLVELKNQIEKDVAALEAKANYAVDRSESASAGIEKLRFYIHAVADYDH